MALEQTGCRRGSLRAADIGSPLGHNVETGKHLFDTAVDEGPRAHVLRLFLTPHDIGLAISGHDLAEGGERKGMELFDADEGDVLDLALLAPLEEIEIDLARAQHD